MCRCQIKLNYLGAGRSVLLNIIVFIGVYAITDNLSLCKARDRTGPEKPGKSLDFVMAFPGLESPGKGHWSWKVLKIC